MILIIFGVCPFTSSIIFAILSIPTAVLVTITDEVTGTYCTDEPSGNLTPICVTNSLRLLGAASSPESSDPNKPPVSPPPLAPLAVPPSLSTKPGTTLNCLVNSSVTDVSDAGTIETTYSSTLKRIVGVQRLHICLRASLRGTFCNCKLGTLISLLSIPPPSPEVCCVFTTKVTPFSSGFGFGSLSRAILARRSIASLRGIS